MSDQQFDQIDRADAPGLASPDASDAHDLATASLARALGTCFTILRGAMLFAIGVFLLRGLFYVETGKAVVIRRFGSYLRDDKGAVRVYSAQGSLHYAIPIIEQVERIDLQSRTLKLDRSFMPNRNALQALSGGGEEKLNPATDGYTITGDTNIMHSQWEVSYQINPDKAEKYLLAFKEDQIGIDPLTGQAVMRSGAEHFLEIALADAVIRVTAGMRIDDALNEQIPVYITRVRAELESVVMAETCGIDIRDMRLIDKTPPSATKQAFVEVSASASARSTLRDNAETAAKKILNEADSKATQIISDATDYRSRLLSDTGADVENLQKLLAQFQATPDSRQVYLDQYYHQVVQESLAGTRKYILRPGQTWLMIGPAQQDLLGLTGDKKTP